MRGDVFDGRGFLKSAISGKEADAKSKTKNIDFDVDLKLGAVAASMARRCAASTQDFPAQRRHQSFALTASSARHAVTADCAAARRARGDLSRDQ
jgi:hypothetical protein